MAKANNQLAAPHCKNLQSRKLTSSQLAAAARLGGWRNEEDLRIIVSIALAESSGYEGRIGDNGDSWGSLQINKPSHSAITPQCACKAPCAFNFARGIKESAGFGAWSVYPIRSSSYLPSASAAVRQTRNLTKGQLESVYGGAAGAAVVGALDWQGENINAGQKALDAATALPRTILTLLGKLLQVQTWIRVAEVGGGSVILVIGLRMLVKGEGFAAASKTTYRGSKVRATKVAKSPLTLVRKVKG